MATETLARRDPRDAVGLLINLLVPPIRYEVRPVQGPGAAGVLFVAGERFNVRRLYTVPPLPETTVRRLIDPTTPTDGSALIAARLGDEWVRLELMSTSGRVIRNNVLGVRANLARAARANLDAQQQLLKDIHLIEARNRAIVEANRRIESPLRHHGSGSRAGSRSLAGVVDGPARLRLRTAASHPQADSRPGDSAPLRPGISANHGHELLRAGDAGADPRGDPADRIDPRR